jgi:predicted nucleotidyltransferase
LEILTHVDLIRAQLGDEMCNKKTVNAILNSVSKLSRSIFKNRLNSVILYGSYARGDMDNESDVDIIVIVEMTPLEISQYRKQIVLLSSKLSIENDVTVSIHLQDYNTFNAYKDVLPFFMNVVREGVFVDV